MKATSVKRGVKIAAATALCAALPGCDAVIPRRDLQLLAATLPPGPEVSPADVEVITARIREETGVVEFEFSDSNFEPEMKLPRGTGWILGLFLGDQQEQGQ